jgi:hypothetical protein
METGSSSSSGKGEGTVAMLGELLLPSKNTSKGCCPVPIKPPLLGGGAANGTSCWSRINNLGMLCVQLLIMVAMVSCDAVRAGTQA